MELDDLLAALKAGGTIPRGSPLHEASPAAAIGTPARVICSLEGKRHRRGGNTRHMS